MIRFSHRVALLGLSFAAANCASPGGPKPSPGLHSLEDGTRQIRTDEFTVPAGEEMFLCYAVTVDEAIDVQSIVYEYNPVVHHLLLAETLEPEPDGVSECAVLFKTSWVPMFQNGVGDARIDIPDGSALPLAKGTQVVIQLHLLNASAEDRSSDVTLDLHPSTTPVESKAGIYAFGTTKVELPPHETTTVRNDCVVNEEVDVFAVFPHMHYLGESMRLLVGPSEEELEAVFSVDSWDFDQQGLFAHPLQFHKGDFTRIECTFNNNTDELVAFGDSSRDEMCLLPTFRTGYVGPSGCIESSGFFPDEGGSDSGGSESGDSTGGEEVCESEGNENGIGAPCVAGGDECMSGTSCTSSLNGDPEGTPGFCLKVGCASTAECGTDAACCTPPEGGGLVSICVPEICQPSDCVNVD